VPHRVHAFGTKNEAVKPDQDLQRLTANPIHQKDAQPIPVGLSSTNRLDTANHFQPTISGGQIFWATRLTIGSGAAMQYSVHGCSGNSDA
jgi:hypothetical protein